MAIRAYLANSNDIIREGIKGILLKNPIFNVCGEYTNYIDFVSSVERLKPTLLFCDVSNDTYNQISKHINRVHFTCPKTAIVAIFHSSDPKDYQDFLSIEGISGFFNTDIKTDELFRGLSDVLSGKVYIQKSIKKTVENINAGIKSDKYKINSLTKREIEVLKQVAAGMFNKEIATSLNISERTVKNHMSNIFKKIEVSDRTQAAVFAIKNNLVNI